MKNNLLLQRRKTLEYSQQDIANLVGIDRSYYTRIENGMTPSVKVAKKLGYHLGFEWTIFFAENSANNAQNKRKVVI